MRVIILLYHRKITSYDLTSAVRQQPPTPWLEIFPVTVNCVSCKRHEFKSPKTITAAAQQRDACSTSRKMSPLLPRMTAVALQWFKRPHWFFKSLTKVLQVTKNCRGHISLIHFWCVKKKSFLMSTAKN